MFDPQLWFLFPLGIVVACLGMSSGVSGSNFWIPIYMVWLRIEPSIGFWLSLLTMLFGFGSGVVKNLRAGTIDWLLVKRYLPWSLCAALLGGSLSPYAPQKWLIIFFAVFVFAYAVWMLMHKPKNEEQPQETTAWGLALIAGFIHGLIATGLGKLLLPRLMKHQIKHHAHAVGSTVLLVFVTSLGSVLIRLRGDFLVNLAENREQIIAMMIWVAPGVIVGGQLGPVVSRWMPKKYVRPYVGVLLMLIACLMFYRIFG